MQILGLREFMQKSVKKLNLFERSEFLVFSFFERGIGVENKPKLLLTTFYLLLK